MTIYTKTTDFQAKDALASGNPLKIVKGTEIDDEFDAIATADATNLKKDGTVTATGNIPMGTYKFTGLGSGSAAADSVSLSQVQAGLMNWVDSGGTANAITATYSPAVASVSDGQLFYVRAGFANSTTTPTFSPSGLTARTIVKTGGVALVAGDIVGDGHEIVLRYDLANTRYELLNPGTITNSTNLNGGSVGTIPYQSGANTTAMLAAGTAGYALIANGAAAPVWTDKTASTTVAGFVEFGTDAEVLTGTDTTRAPSISSMRNSLVAVQTVQATTSGTSKEYTAIPSWVKHVDIFFKQTSLNGVTDLAVELGTSGGYISSGYVGKTATMSTGGTGTTTLSSGFNLRNGGAATEYVGKMSLDLFDASNHIWMCTANLSDAQATAVIQTSGYVTLSAALTKVLIYSFDGSSSFDLGSIGCSWY